MIDVTGLKDHVDIMDLAGRYTALKQWSRGELAGPCPQCGGSDRFHVNAGGWWMCYRCHAKHADAIELVRFLGLAADFKGAATWLTGYLGGALSVPGAPQRRPAPKAKEVLWRDAGWQEATCRAVVAGMMRLEDPAGQPGRDYLLGRGIGPETWRAWGLGYGRPWHPRLRREAAAILLPWAGHNIVKAVQYRFFGPGIDDCPDPHERKGLRFAQRKGGERTIYGCDLLGAHHEALIVIEGELNALSAWQAARAAGLAGVDVVSVGSEGNVGNPRVLALAGRYRRVIAWFDDEERTRQALAAIPGARGLKSPPGPAGEKLDANAMLQRGALAGFLALAVRG